MKYKKELIKKIKDFVNVKTEAIYLDETKVLCMTFMQLRDILIENSTILDEDMDKQIYVVEILSGFFLMNHAIVAIKLCDNNIEFAGYAKEGIINQQTVKKIIDCLKNDINC